MDLFFVLQFLWWNIAHRRLPFTTICWLISSCCTGSAAVWLYPLNVLLIISIPLSMIFFRQSRYALWLAGQAPLRLLFMQPSLSLGLWLIQAAGIRHVAIRQAFCCSLKG